MLHLRGCASGLRNPTTVLELSAPGHQTVQTFHLEEQRRVRHCSSELFIKLTCLYTRKDRKQKNDVLYSLRFTHSCLLLDRKNYIASNLSLDVKIQRALIIRYFKTRIQWDEVACNVAVACDSGAGDRYRGWQLTNRAAS